MIKIIHLSAEYFARWDDYVNQSPRGTFYHLIGWKNIIEKTFGFKSLYLIALNEDDKITGILPLFLMKNILGRKHLISNPSSMYAGMCGDTDQIKIELFKKTKEIAIENNVHYLELRQAEFLMFNIPTIKDFVTMILKIGRDEKSVWENALKSVTRNRIRKSWKEKLTIDFGSKYLDDFYCVFSINMRDLGTPVYPKTFFSHILEEFGHSANLIIVKHHNVVIGGMLYICHKNKVISPYVSSLRKYNKLCPNEFLYWEAIKFACKNNFEYFDFGRSTIDSGTFKFKEKWGAVPLPLYYQYFLNKSHKMPEVSAHKNQYQMAINLWKKIPLPITNILGPRIVRYLPEF